MDSFKDILKKGSSDGTKKLKDFYDPKSPFNKKFKALVSFFEASSSDEIKMFLEKDYSTVWNVFLDNFQTLEQKDDSKNKELKEIEKLLSILKYILIHLPSKIKEKWQARSILNILEKTLCKENRIEIRIQGLQLLLYFLKDLETPEPAQLNLYGSLLDFDILKPRNYTKKIIVPLPTISGGKIASFISPTSSKPEEQIALFDVILEFMGSNPNVFPSFWQYLISHYIHLFYPDICKEVGLVDSFSDAGFLGQCPPAVQAAIISRLQTWMTNENISTFLWSTKENCAIILEIYRQSSELPIEYVESIKKSITIFRTWFLGGKGGGVGVPLPLQEQPEKLKSYQKFFIERLSCVFKTESKSENAEQHVTLCLEIFQLFKQTFEKVDQLSLEIRDVLLFTLLEITTTLLKVDNPNETLARSLASVLMDTLLFIWLNSKITDETKWARFQEKIQSLFHRIEPVSQLKMKLIQISLVLKNFLYPNLTKKKQVFSGLPTNKKDVAQTIDFKKLNFAKKDNVISSMQWDLESCLFMWNALLRIFTGANRIKDPGIQAEAISVISNIIDIFLHAESKAPFSHLTDPKNPTSFSLLQKFGFLLLEATTLDDKYVTGKAIAYGALCRLFCRHYKLFPGIYPQKLLPYFYATIHRAFSRSTESDIISHTIIENSSNIFNLALPGATVLIPYYLFQIKRLLRSSIDLNVETRRKALTIIGSVICQSTHFKDLVLPMQFASHFEKGKDSDETSIKGLAIRERVAEILIHLLSEKGSEEEIKIICLWNISMLLLTSLLCSPNMDLMNSLLKHVFLYIQSKENSNISTTALDVLNSLLQIHSQIDINFLRTTFEAFLTIIESEIRDFLRDSSDNFEISISNQIFAISDWALTVPSLLDDEHLRKKLFVLILQSIRIQSRESSKPVITKKEKKRSDKETEDVLPSIPSKKPFVTIKEAARYVLHQLMDIYRTFPPIPGIEFSSSNIIETDDSGVDERCLYYFSFNDVLFCFVEIPNPHPTSKNTQLARLIVRDITGKYAWDFVNFQCLSEEKPEIQLIKSLLQPNKVQSVPPQPLNLKPYPARQKNSIALYDATVDGSKVDKMKELLQYLGEKHKDCLPPGQESLCQPTLLPKQYLIQIMNTQKGLQTQQASDKDTLNKYNQNKPKSEKWAIQPPTEVKPEHAYQNVRLFLSQFGFLNHDSPEQLRLFENNTKLLSKLKILDKLPRRECVKVGLIYIPHGLEEQEALLKNGVASDGYKEFVSGLGWNIDINTHKGYTGGLDPLSKTGNTAPYYANCGVEVMYHDLVRMPTDPNDPNQINKKRHVGNDIVHIVWSEHVRDYSPKTISGAFGDSVIIIYPLPNGLYRIQVAKKQKTPFFGPLQHGMTVTKQLLPIVVRLTAINAFRYIRSLQEGYERPIVARNNTLQEILAKLVSTVNYEDLLKRSFSIEQTDLFAPRPLPNKSDIDIKV